MKRKRVPIIFILTLRIYLLYEFLVMIKSIRYSLKYDKCVCFLLYNDTNIIIINSHGCKTSQIKLIYFDLTRNLVIFI